MARVVIHPQGVTLSRVVPYVGTPEIKARRLVLAIRYHSQIGNPGEDVFLEPPKPPGAVELMKVIEGDGSPWSYLSASMLGREAAEFGAAWHGSSWTEHTILGKPPWEMASLNASPVEVWEGDDIALDAWKPAYREKGEAKEIVLHSYSQLETEAVYRATDTCQPGSYDFEMDVVRVCFGGGGYIH